MHKFVLSSVHSLSLLRRRHVLIHVRAAQRGELSGAPSSAVRALYDKALAAAALAIPQRFAQLYGAPEASSSSAAATAAGAAAAGAAASLPSSQQQQLQLQLVARTALPPCFVSAFPRMKKDEDRDDFRWWKSAQAAALAGAQRTTSSAKDKQQYSEDLVVVVDEVLGCSLRPALASRIRALAPLIAKVTSGSFVLEQCLDAFCREQISAGIGRAKKLLPLLSKLCVREASSSSSLIVSAAAAAAPSSSPPSRSFKAAAAAAAWAAVSASSPRASPTTAAAAASSSSGSSSPPPPAPVFTVNTARLLEVEEAFVTAYNTSKNGAGVAAAKLQLPTGVLGIAPLPVREIDGPGAAAAAAAAAAVELDDLHDDATGDKPAAAKSAAAAEDEDADDDGTILSAPFRLDMRAAVKRVTLGEELLARLTALGRATAVRDAFARLTAALAAVIPDSKQNTKYVSKEKGDEDAPAGGSDDDFIDDEEDGDGDDFDYAGVLQRRAALLGELRSSARMIESKIRAERPTPSQVEVELIVPSVVTATGSGDRAPRPPVLSVETEIALAQSFVSMPYVESAASAFVKLATGRKVTGVAAVAAVVAPSAATAATAAAAAAQVLPAAVQLSAPSPAFLVWRNRMQQQQQSAPGAAAGSSSSSSSSRGSSSSSRTSSSSPALNVKPLVKPARSTISAPLGPLDAAYHAFVLRRVFAWTISDHKPKWAVRLARGDVHKDVPGASATPSYPLCFGLSWRNAKAGVTRCENAVSNDFVWSPFGVKKGEETAAVYAGRWLCRLSSRPQLRGWEEGDCSAIRDLVTAGSAQVQEMASIIKNVTALRVAESDVLNARVSNDQAACCRSRAAAASLHLAQQQQHLQIPLRAAASRTACRPCRRRSLSSRPRRS